MDISSLTPDKQVETSILAGCHSAMQGLRIDKPGMVRTESDFFKKLLLLDCKNTQACS